MSCLILSSVLVLFHLKLANYKLSKTRYFNSSQQDSSTYDKLKQKINPYETSLKAQGKLVNDGSLALTKSKEHTKENGVKTKKVEILQSKKGKNDNKGKKPLHAPPDQKPSTQEGAKKHTSNNSNERKIKKVEKTGKAIKVQERIKKAQDSLKKDNKGKTIKATPIRKRVNNNEGISKGPRRKEKSKTVKIMSVQNGVHKDKISAKKLKNNMNVKPVKTPVRAGMDTLSNTAKFMSFLNKMKENKIKTNDLGRNVYAKPVVPVQQGINTNSDAAKIMSVLKGINEYESRMKELQRNQGNRPMQAPPVERGANQLYGGVFNKGGINMGRNLNNNIQFNRQSHSFGVEPDYPEYLSAYRQ